MNTKTLLTLTAMTLLLPLQGMAKTPGVERVSLEYATVSVSVSPSSTQIEQLVMATGEKDAHFSAASDLLLKEGAIVGFRAWMVTPVEDPDGPGEIACPWDFTEIEGRIKIRRAEDGDCQA